MMLIGLGAMVLEIVLLALDYGHQPYAIGAALFVAIFATALGMTILYGSSIENETASEDTPKFVLNRGNTAVGWFTAFFFWGFIPTLAITVGIGIVGTIALTVFGLFGFLIVAVNRIVKLYPAHFEVSRLHRTTRHSYSEIMEARELIIQPRGNQRLGVRLALRESNKPFTVNVAGFDAKISNDVREFLSQRTSPGSYQKATAR